MKIVAIKQSRSGQNIHFISDEYAEYTLIDFLVMEPQIPFENIRVVTSKSGKKYVRLKADASKANNLDNIATYPRPPLRLVNKQILMEEAIFTSMVAISPDQKDVSI